MLSRHVLLAFRPVTVWLLRRANLLKVASLCILIDNWPSCMLGLTPTTVVLQFIHCIHVVRAPASTADKVVSAGRRPNCPVSAKKGTCRKRNSLHANWMAPVVRSVWKKVKPTKLVPAANRCQSIRIGFGDELSVERLWKRHRRDLATTESIPSLIGRPLYLKRNDDKLRSALICRRPVRRFGVTCVPKPEQASEQACCAATCCAPSMYLYFLCLISRGPTGASVTLQKKRLLKGSSRAFAHTNASLSYEAWQRASILF